MTVFVIQKQMKLDDATGDLVPRFSSLERAKRWGDLKYLLSPTAHPFNPESIISDLKEKLETFTEDDHLLLIGNPALIGMATAIAAKQTSGTVRFLQWPGRQKDYMEISVRLF